MSKYYFIYEHVSISKKCFLRSHTIKTLRNIITFYKSVPTFKDTARYKCRQLAFLIPGKLWLVLNKVWEKFTHLYRLYFPQVLFDRFPCLFILLFIIIRALNGEKKITLDHPYIFLSLRIMKTSNLKLDFWSATAFLYSALKLWK